MDIAIDSLIRAGQVETTEALRAFAARRLSFTLRRFVHRIRHVVVRVVDVNGPRGGIDSRCAITVELANGRQLFVDATGASPFAAIAAAASRLGEAVRREQTRRVAHRGANARSDERAEPHMPPPDPERVAQRPG